MRADSHGNRQPSSLQYFAALSRANALLSNRLIKAKLYEVSRDIRLKLQAPYRRLLQSVSGVTVKSVDDRSMRAPASGVCRTGPSARLLSALWLPAALLCRSSTHQMHASALHHSTLRYIRLLHQQSLAVLYKPIQPSFLSAQCSLKKVSNHLHRVSSLVVRKHA